MKIYHILLFLTLSFFACQKDDQNPGEINADKISSYIHDGQRVTEIIIISGSDSYAVANINNYLKLDGQFMYFTTSGGVQITFDLNHMVRLAMNVSTLYIYF